MTAPATIPGLSAIADRYDAILCDVWGVIHNGRESFPGALDALVRFRAQTGGPTVLLSNAPRPAEDVKHQLRRLQVADEVYTGFVTSGDATRAELMRRAPGPVWIVGAERDLPLYDGIELDFVDPHAAAFVSVTGLADDETETPEDYRAALAIAAARGLPLVCANPDRVVQRGEKLIYCAGALADLYETLGGEVLMAGKPYAPIYEMAYAEIDRLAGRQIPRDRILAIGDGLITDVAGAQGQGLDCLFIASGIHAGDSFGVDSGLDPARIGALLDRAGLAAAYAMPHLVW